MRYTLALIFVMTCSVITIAGAANNVEEEKYAPASLVNPYLKIQTELATDSFTSVQQNASAMLKELASWGSLGLELGDTVRRLERAESIDEARIALAAETDALLLYSKTQGLNLPDGLRVAYCPMKQQSWLQEGEDIRNPYYGSAMLDCGEFNDE